MEMYSLIISRILNILVVIIASLISYLTVIVLLKRFSHAIIGNGITHSRIRGVVTLFLVVARWVLIAIVILMALSEFNINLAPLLAGAGIVGIAVSFAAQALLKDVASGIAILIGNQYRPGDVIVTNGIQGVVESISLMKTVIRDKQTVYYIPNGHISVIGVVQTAHNGRSNLNRKQ